MRNLILTLCLIATFAIADGWKFPGWDVTDAAVWQEAVDTAQRKGHLETSTYMLAIAQNPPANFEAAKGTITAALQQLDCSEAKILEKIKQYCYCTGQFQDEVVAYAKTTPNWYDIYLTRYDDTEWSWGVVFEALLSGTGTEKEVIWRISKLNSLAVGLDKGNEEVVDILKKLNKLYSAKLIQNKEKWSPVVAHIRTLMETYE